MELEGWIKNKNYSTLRVILQLQRQEKTTFPGRMCSALHLLLLHVACFHRAGGIFSIIR